MGITIVIQFIRKNWLPMLITAILFSFIIYVQTLRTNIISLKMDVLRLNTDLDNCLGTIEDRNNTIESWSKQSEQQFHEMTALRSQLDDITKYNNKRIDNILKKKTPVTCSESIGYLIEVAKEY